MSSKKLCKVQSKSKVFWLVLCFVLFFVNVLANISNKNDNIRIEKLKNAQIKEQNSFENSALRNSKSTRFVQNKEIKGIVLINVGNKDNTNVSSNDIDNIICVLFEKNNRKQIVNIVAVQKEMCIERGKKDSLLTIKQSFDRNNPQKMYDIIEKTLDYKVDSYIVYNDDTIKKVMDLIYVVCVYFLKDDSLCIDDLARVNEIQHEIEKEHLIKEYSAVTGYGFQTLNRLQALAYSKLYRNNWDSEYNDWRQIYLISQIIKGIKGANYNEFDRIGEILTSGDHDFDDKQRIMAGVAVITHKELFKSRWTAAVNYINHNKVK